MKIPASGRGGAYPVQSSEGTERQMRGSPSLLFLGWCLSSFFFLFVSFGPNSGEGAGESGLPPPVAAAAVAVLADAVSVFCQSAIT